MSSTSSLNVAVETARVPPPLLGPRVAKALATNAYIHQGMHNARLPQSESSDSVEKPAISSAHDGLLHGMPQLESHLPLRPQPLGGARASERISTWRNEEPTQSCAAVEAG